MFLRSTAPNCVAALALRGGGPGSPLEAEERTVDGFRAMLRSLRVPRGRAESRASYAMSVGKRTKHYMLPGARSGIGGIGGGGGQQRQRQRAAA